MRIDIDAFIKSLPIMGIGLLGIFIVTLVIIIGIYVLRALTAGKPDTENKNESASDIKEKADSSTKKESAMDLMEEREKKDFWETDKDFYISSDL